MDSSQVNDLTTHDFDPGCSIENLQKQYDKDYYATGCGPLPYERNAYWINAFGMIADQVIRCLQPKRVLDAGCAMGFLVESFWDRGVECYGIDFSPYAISQVRRDMRRYCRVASLTDPIEGKYDLVTCIEVLEHIPPAQAELAAENLCRVTDTIIFSSSPSDVTEPTHCNVRPTIYWLNLFSRFDFWPSVVFDAGFIAPHAMLLRRGQRPTHAEVLVQFSELLRLKAACVQKMSEIDKLNRQTESVSAQLKTLDAERTTLEEQLREVQSMLANDRTSAKQVLHEIETKLASAEKEGVTSRLAEQDLREQLKAAEVTIKGLRAETQRSSERLSDSRDLNAVLLGENATLVQERDHLRNELQSIASSPGWKLVERYRTWLWRQRESSPRFFRTYEKLAVWLLRSSTHERKLHAQEIDSPAKTSSSDDIAVQRIEQVVQKPASFSEAKDPEYQRWIRENEPGMDDLRRQSDHCNTWSSRPRISVIVPVYHVSEHALRQCLQSVCDQSYPHWELCLAHGCPEDEANRQLLATYAAREPRVRVRFLEGNMGISGNTNAGLEMATGDYIAFLDHDDVLAPFALFEVASLLNQLPATDLVYSDHDYISETDAIRFAPLFKPDWSPEIMYSANYITHLTVIRKHLVDEVGVFDNATDGAQDWDFFLRSVSRTDHIQHIAKILYHWRTHAESTALNNSAKPYICDAQLLALSKYMNQIGMPATPEILPDGLLHVRWRGSDRTPLISIIIPTRDKVDLLSKCISTLVENTAYPSYEILIIDTGSSEPATRTYYKTLHGVPQVRLFDYTPPFNYSAVNNFGARHAAGEYLLFLNNDIEITHPDWLDELRGWATDPGVGVVGGKLLRADGRIQHAGVVIGLCGFADHPFADLPSLTYGMYGSTGWYRNYLAVTGACMIMRREVFDLVGGFDESFTLCGSDVEICLRARKHGFRVVYNPFVELIHHERQTRKDDIPAQDFFTSYKHYEEYLENGDPYWNRSLSIWNKKIGFRFTGEQSALEFVQRYLQKLNPAWLPERRTETAVKPSMPKCLPSEEETLVSWFDFTEDEIRSLTQQRASMTGPQEVKKVVWFIPPFTNAFYGGIFTILRFADYWHRTKGVHNMFAICGSAKSKVMLEQIRSVLPDCTRQDLFILPSIKDVVDLPKADAAISTLWVTAYFALRYRDATRQFYFIQDFEPAFFRAGSASALVESTYRLGFYGITNTQSLRHFYEAEYGGNAIHFTPCVDVKLFKPAAKRDSRERRVWQVCCYARPSHARNAFELLAAAMRRLKARLGARVRIVSAGEEWNPADHSLQGIVENLGVLRYEDTARLYRESDIGVVLMLTRHPSYIPMELMASGCLVVTNRNHWTEWLLQHERTCLLSYTTASSIAETIERGLTDEKLRKEITEAALMLVRERYQDWTPEMEKIYRYVCDPILDQNDQPRTTGFMP